MALYPCVGGSNGGASALLFNGYSRSTSATGNNIIVPIAKIAYKADEITISNNIITFNKAFSGTIKVRVNLTTGQTQTHKLLVKKNNNTILTGNSGTGYSNLTLTLEGTFSASSGDTLAIYVDITNYQFNPIIVEYITIM